MLKWISHSCSKLSTCFFMFFRIKLLREHSVKINRLFAHRFLQLRWFNNLEPWHIFICPQIIMSRSRHSIILSLSDFQAPSQDRLSRALLFIHTHIIRPGAGRPRRLVRLHIVRLRIFRKRVFVRNFFLKSRFVRIWPRRATFPSEGSSAGLPEGRILLSRRFLYFERRFRNVGTRPRPV